MTLADVLPFGLQIQVWGSYVAGDAAEPTATLCEGRDRVLPPNMERWRDRTAAEMAGWARAEGSGPYEPVPLWWALPALGEIHRREVMAEVARGLIPDAAMRAELGLP